MARDSDKFYSDAEKAAESVMLVVMKETKGPGEAMICLDLVFKALLTMYASAEMESGVPPEESVKEALTAIAAINKKQGNKIQDSITRLSSMAIKMLDSEKN